MLQVVFALTLDTNVKSDHQHLIHLIEQSVRICNIDFDLQDEEKDKEKRVEATKAFLAQHEEQYTKDIEKNMSTVSDMLKPGGEDLADIVGIVDKTQGLTTSKLQLLLPTNSSAMQRVRYLTELALEMVEDVGYVLLKMVNLSTDFLRDKCTAMETIFSKEPDHLKHAWVRLLLFMRVLWPGCLTEDEMCGGLLKKDKQEIQELALSKLDKIKEMAPPVYSLDSNGLSMSNRICVPRPLMPSSVEKTEDMVKFKMRSIEVEDQHDPLALDALAAPMLKMYIASKKFQALMLRAQDAMSEIDIDDEEAGWMSPEDEAGGRRVKSCSAARGSLKQAVVLVDSSKKLEEVLDWVGMKEKDTETDIDGCINMLSAQLKDFVSPSALDELSKPLCQRSMYHKLLIVKWEIEHLHKQIAVEEFIGSMATHFHHLLYKGKADKFFLSEQQVEKMSRVQTFKTADMMLNVKSYQAGVVEMHKAFHISQSTS